MNVIGIAGEDFRAGDLVATSEDGWLYKVRDETVVVTDADWAALRERIQRRDPLPGSPRAHAAAAE